MNERRDGGFEVLLAFAQFMSVRRAAEGADRGEGSVCQHLHLRVARDELYAEPGSFSAGTQAVTFDAGRRVVLSGCIPLVIKPQGYEPRLSSVMALANALQAFTCSYRSRSLRSNAWARSAVRLWKR